MKFHILGIRLYDITQDHVTAQGAKAIFDKRTQDNEQDLDALMSQLYADVLYFMLQKSLAEDT